jgi:hypothetical protein
MIMNLAGVLLLLAFFWTRSKVMAAVMFLLALFIALCSYFIGQIIWKMGSDSFQEASNFDPREALFYVHTSPSLLEAFSLRPARQDNAVPITDQSRVPLVNILLSRGIHTVLYSNQSRKGTWNLAAGVVFGQAEQTFTINTPTGDLETSAKPLDSEFLPRALADPAALDLSNRRATPLAALPRLN